MVNPNTISRSRPLTIGDLSARTGVNIETIRYYEKIGLLPAPARSVGNRRLYEADHHKRLSFIRRARDLGFPIEQIRTLLDLARSEGLACGEALAVTEHHLTGIRSRLRDLRRLERVLMQLAASCRAGARDHCPVLEALTIPGRARN